MEPNQNVPSERDWTDEEREMYYSFQRQATGIFSGGAVANNACLNDEWRNLSVTSRGIHVTSIVPPSEGWPIAYHCPLCKRTEIVLSPWAIKPKEGDYWLMNDMCGDEFLGFEHNMRLGMKGWNAPIELKPGKLVP
jgi:hypothetical protein